MMRRLVKDYHCCVNDCVVFRKSHSEDCSHLLQCPHCSESRYKEGTKIPRKRYKYLPLEARKRRLFSNKITSKILQSHSDPQMSEPNTVTTIHQSEAWKP